MSDRGWKVSDVEAAVADGPTGTTTDLRSSATTQDHLPRNDPATLYGQDPNQYVVVNDRTGEVVQVADKGDPDWVVDDRITWDRAEQDADSEDTGSESSDGA